MIVDKVINNNLVRSHSDENIEVLVMGCGLGFKKRPGDQIDPSLVEKVYRIEDKRVSNQLVELISSVPNEQIQTANAIVSYAKKTLNRPISDNIYISITDHLNFALQRHEQGIYLKNALLWEIRKYYSKEYDMGMQAIRIINEKLDVELPIDEAGYFALHFAGASLKDGNVSESRDILEIVQGILQIVKYQLKVEFDEESIHFERFLTHLKFFAQRVLTDKVLNDENEEIIRVVQEKYHEEYKCAIKIGAYIEKHFSRKLTDTEMHYLTVHLKRITSK